MNKNLVRLLIAITIALAVTFYFINSKKSDTANISSSVDSSIGESAHSRTIESSAVSGALSSTAQVSGSQGSNEGESTAGVNSANTPAGQSTSTTENDLPASVQETIRERRAGSQNSGVDKSRTDAAAGAVKAYEEAEGKK